MSICDKAKIFWNQMQVWLNAILLYTRQLVDLDDDFYWYETYFLIISVLNVVRYVYLLDNQPFERIYVFTFPLWPTQLPLLLKSKICVQGKSSSWMHSINLVHQRDWNLALILFHFSFSISLNVLLLYWSAVCHLHILFSHGHSSPWKLLKTYAN